MLPLSQRPPRAHAWFAGWLPHSPPTTKCTCLSMRCVLFQALASDLRAVSSFAYLHSIDVSGCEMVTGFAAHLALSFSFGCQQIAGATGNDIQSAHAWWVWRESLVGRQVLHRLARSRRPRHGSKGQGIVRDFQANKTHWIGSHSGNCDGQLEVERRIREDRSNADSMPRPPTCAQVTPG